MGYDRRRRGAWFGGGAPGGLAVIPPRPFNLASGAFAVALYCVTGRNRIFVSLAIPVVSVAIEGSRFADVSNGGDGSGHRTEAWTNLAGRFWNASPLGKAPVVRYA